MQYATLYNGEQVPILGLGTWAVGGRFSPDSSRDAEFIASIQTAIELGYTHIDTAEMYAGGHTEQLVGRAVKGFKRQDVFVATKVSPNNLRYEGVLRALTGSLKRLDMDYVDLYLIHWPSKRIPLEETFKALNEAVARGQVRHLGVSNFDLDELQQAQALSDTPIITNQVPYSLSKRQYVKNGVLAYCQEADILLTAYSPLKGGVAKSAIVRQIAEQHASTPSQVALHWLIRQKNVITIPKSTNEGHLQENLGALDLHLSEHEIEQLDAKPGGSLWGMLP
jgi:diketogulonate reductase-like aldo/keto reductase